MERIDKVKGTFGKHNEKEISREDVSVAVIRRLPRYHRYLGELLRENHLRISSAELSALMGVTASQIRQDLNCFGGFGQQGYGYNVVALREEIGKILGLDLPKKTILIEAGNLGRAILTHMNFEEKSFSIAGIFDRDENYTGEILEGIAIRHTDDLEEFCQAEKPDVAILCVPKMASEDLVRRLVAVGIKGFWNFSHYDISIKHPEVYVENVRINDSLMTICYMLDE